MNLSYFQSWTLWEFRKMEFHPGKRTPLEKTVYDDIDNAIETRTKFLHTIMLKISVPVIVSQYIMWSFVEYFWSGFSNNSFRLIYPWAWVFFFASKKQEKFLFRPEWKMGFHISPPDLACKNLRRQEQDVNCDVPF